MRAQELDSEEYAKALATVDKALADQSAVDGSTQSYRDGSLSARKEGRIQQVRSEGSVDQSAVQRSVLHAGRQLRFAAPVQGGRGLCARSDGPESERLEVDERAWRQPAANRRGRRRQGDCSRKCIAGDPYERADGEHAPPDRQLEELRRHFNRAFPHQAAQEGKRGAAALRHRSAREGLQDALREIRIHAGRSDYL